MKQGEGCSKKMMQDGYEVLDSGEMRRKRMGDRWLEPAEWPPKDDGGFLGRTYHPVGREYEPEDD